MFLVVCAVLLQDSEIEKLIEQLPAAEAHRKLVVLGRQAIPALQKANDRARTKPVIVEIRRNERREEARRLLSPDLLAEAPVVPNLLVSDRRDDWLTLLRRCAGVRVVDGELVRMSRAWSRATARDLVLLVRLYLDGGLRDDTVEGVLFAMSDSFRLSLPDLALRAREDFERRGKPIPRVVRPAQGDLAGTRGAVPAVSRFWPVDEVLACLTAIEAAAHLGAKDFLICAAGDLDPRVRRAAARSLLRLGIALWDVLAENPRDPDQSWEMNRLFRSDLFDRLGQIPLRESRHSGTILELAAAWSKESGIPIETELEETCEVQATTLADALRQVVDRFRIVLVEKDRIRIVPIYEAEELWSRWRN